MVLQQGAHHVAQNSTTAGRPSGTRLPSGTRFPSVVITSKLWARTSTSVGMAPEATGARSNAVTKTSGRRNSVNVRMFGKRVGVAGGAALDLLHDLGCDVAEGLSRGRLRMRRHDGRAGVAADDDLRIDGHLAQERDA